MAERGREDLVEKHRQQLLTRRLLGVIGILCTVLVVFAARRWYF
ncbi:MAG TPA: hypothetical protein VF601_13970 [Beijerinckiaceae bacterium]